MMEHLLLSLLRDARHGVKSDPQSCDYEALYRLAQEHQVSALIYNQIYSFPDLPAELKARWSRDALTVNALQTMRSARFLQLYQKLREGGVDALVVKGIILRNLYPQPDSRQSNDEDVFVPLEQISEATRLLVENGAVLRHESRYENAFLDPSCGLSIELHGTLFDPENKVLAGYQSLFDDSFRAPAEHRINGVSVFSLNHDLHFLFLMTHLAKHLLFSGVGIRQVLDLVMYAEAFREEIHWDPVYRKLDSQSLLTLTANVLDIGRAYLGLDPSVPLPGISSDSASLLEDIMGAGVFGASTRARVHSAAFTLAAADGQDPASGALLLRRLFPPLKELQARTEHAYLQEKPWLLPLAWTRRLGSYLAHRESGTQEQDSLALAARRVELLKQYGVIK